MFLFCCTLRFRSLLLFSSAFALIMFFTWSVGVAPAQEATPSEKADSGELSVEYARACLKLAEIELAEAVEQNRRSKNSVADYDLERLRLHVRFAQQNLSYAEQGADHSQSIIGHIEMQSRLAELNLRTAEDLRQVGTSPITDLQLERLRSYSDVCRLRLELIRDPVSALKIVDHLHWETHRLSEEVLLLNRRVERLEETVMR